MWCRDRILFVMNKLKNQSQKKIVIRMPRQNFPARMLRLLNVPENRLAEILRPYHGFSCRLNRLRNVSRERVIENAAAMGVSLNPLPWYGDGFVVDGNKYDLLHTDLAKGGVLYVQNASSYLPVLALEPTPGDSVLDVCAAPGGKSSHIAALTGGDINLWLNDGIATRLENIRQVQKLLGFRYDKLTTFPAQSIDKNINQTFDKILLDIQCTGEGMIDITRPATMRFWDIGRIRKYMYMQTKALNACFRLLRPGGTLVYSTCTFAPEENEAPISNLLKHNADAVVQPLVLNLPNVRRGELHWDDMNFNPQLRGALRILPAPGMEGFFLCRIRKLPTTDNVTTPIDLSVVGTRYATSAE